MVVRHRYYRNGEPSEGSTLHAPYLKPATTLMDAVKRRMQLGNLQQLAQRYVTEDGAVLTAISRFGQDEIRIDVPAPVAPPVRRDGKVMIQLIDYTLWLLDEAGTGLVEYNQRGTATGRAFPGLVPPNGVSGGIRDVIHAHKALWVGFVDYSGGGNGDGGVLRIDSNTGEVKRVGYSDPSGLAVVLTSTPSHVLALYDNNAGTSFVLVKMTPAGEIEAQATGEYSGNVSALFADDDSVHVVGAGGDIGFWQLSGTYLKTFDLQTLTGTTTSFVAANSPTASGTTSAWDAPLGRMLTTGDDAVEGTYHDWEAAGGALEPIVSYEFDHMTSIDPWVTCGDVLLKFHHAGAVEVQRGNARAGTVPDYFSSLPIWDGDGAVWSVISPVSGGTVLGRIGFDGTVATYPLPVTAGIYITPAIQLSLTEFTVPASESTPDPISQLPVRELRVLRSRPGWN